MSRFRVGRGAVVALLLVLVFGVAVALAIQAYQTAGDHRAQADRVLRDYARLAAARVARQSAVGMYYAVTRPKHCSMRTRGRRTKVRPNRVLSTST